MSTERKGCLFGWLSLFVGGSRPAASGAGVLRVGVNTKFVSPAEANFFRVLRGVVGTRGHVLAQVSLRQLLWFPPGQVGLQRWRNKVAARTIDFVVCDAATLRPLVAIGLDDASHARPERKTRDEEVRTLLDAAGLPLVGVLPSRPYDVRELEAALGPCLPPADGRGGRR